jgi:nucleoside-diphosphate-sugar epimerase
MAEPHTPICVTGASGMIGLHICRKLLDMGYSTKVLTRSSHFSDQRAEVFTGDLCDYNSISRFIENAEMLFHCAAELNDDSKMWEVNVKGTEMLLKAASQVSVKYFCYLSSAGVVGKCNRTWVDEDTPCNPQDMYEKSKYVAEKIVAEGIPRCSTVILRPTNVIDDYRAGAIEYSIRSSLIDRIKVFVKGSECAHIVHAEDVADAAIYFINSRFEKPELFIVSCDHERFNTFGGLWSLYKAIERGQPVEEIEPMIHLPIIVPYLLRSLWRGTGNLGNVRYSSEKLLSTGFCYSHGIEGAIRRIAETQSHLIA